MFKLIVPVMQTHKNSSLLFRYPTNMRRTLEVCYTEKYKGIKGFVALELSGNEQVQWFHYMISLQMW